MALTAIQNEQPEPIEAEVVRLRAEVATLKETLDDLKYDIGQLPYGFACEHPAARSLLNQFLKLN